MNTQFPANSTAPNASNVFGAPNGVWCNLSPFCTNCTNELGVGALVQTVQPIGTPARRKLRAVLTATACKTLRADSCNRWPNLKPRGVGRMRDEQQRNDSRGNDTP